MERSDNIKAFADKVKTLAADMGIELREFEENISSIQPNLSWYQIHFKEAKQ